MTDELIRMYHDIIEPRLNELEDIYRRAGETGDAGNVNAERSRFAKSVRALADAGKNIAAEIEAAAGTMLCRRCGHTWTRRSPVRPAQCPKCKSYRWDLDRQEG